MFRELYLEYLYHLSPERYSPVRVQYQIRNTKRPAEEPHDQTPIAENRWLG